MLMLMLMLFIFGGFNAHHEDGLTYSGRTGRPGELFYFLISNSLSQKVNFFTWIFDYDSRSSTVLDLFLPSHSSVMQCLSFQLETLIMLLS